MPVSSWRPPVVPPRLGCRLLWCDGADGSSRGFDGVALGGGNHFLQRQPFGGHRLRPQISLSPGLSYRPGRIGGYSAGAAGRSGPPAANRNKEAD